MSDPDIDAVRDLHKPYEGIWGGLICAEDRHSWPCATAKLIYSDEELS